MAYRRLKEVIVGELLKKVKSNRFVFCGIDIEIHPKTDPSVAYLIWKGRYELQECNFVEKYVEVGAKVIELGASTGLLSALIQRRIGANGRHVAVEANPDLVQYIKLNAGLSVEIVSAAIDYSGAKSVCFAATTNTLNGRLDDGGDRADNSKLVPTTTLGSIVSLYGLSDFVLVMDIEGAEYALVENDPSAFMKCEAIIAEIHPFEAGMPIFVEQEFFQMLADLGFVVRDRCSRVVYLTRDAR